jgi:hypothetical protein
MMQTEDNVVLKRANPERNALIGTVALDRILQIVWDIALNV